MADGGGQALVGAREPVRDGMVHGRARERSVAFAERMQEGDRALPRYAVVECHSPAVPLRQTAISLVSCRGQLPVAVAR